jgi:putative restriction endonuclease
MPKGVEHDPQVPHHKSFDLGAFTVTPGEVLLVSDQANGAAGFHEALMRHHGSQIRQGQRPEWCPAAGHLEWHAREVFKGQAPPQVPSYEQTTGRSREC